MMHMQRHLMLCGSSRYIWTSGHRSVGGYRAQCTMLCQLSVQVLVDVMQALESKSITKQDHDWDS
jgi:hypothetical protein